VRNVPSLFAVVDGLTRLFMPLQPNPCPPTEPTESTESTESTEPTEPAHVARGPLVTWTFWVEDSEASGLANRDTFLLSLCNDTDDMVAVGCGETNNFIVRREFACVRHARCSCFWSSRGGNARVHGCNLYNCKRMRRRYHSLWP
jgi:hypothetical protein